MLVTLRDLLYNYTEDLYDFIKTHYGDTYDPVDEVTTDTEDDHETVTTVATESVENKYKSFEECRSWWKDTRYVERQSFSTNPVHPQALSPNLLPLPDILCLSHLLHWGVQEDHLPLSCGDNLSQGEPEVPGEDGGGGGDS